MTGASGCGVSTLGARLATLSGAVHLDTDGFFWQPTEPPFTRRRPVAERITLIRAAFGTSGWILSGSLTGWGDELAAEAELVVFLEVPTEMRMERLRERERGRYGDRIDPGGDLHATHLDFMAWAADYDTGLTAGRNRARHLAWLEGLDVPHIALDGQRPTDDLAEAVLAAVVRGRNAGATAR